MCREHELGAGTELIPALADYPQAISFKEKETFACRSIRRWQESPQVEPPSGEWVARRQV